MELVMVPVFEMDPDFRQGYAVNKKCTALLRCIFDVPTC
ncbi:hypothetical protein PCIT_b0394 [Pseudoalteromonas citrea]|uniref:Uncharacterized protein n=1 Tax=Pseudoalteromonas citrea TaxID=43655 RepID=A0AAD4FPU7_9GAMM|nr:hypothetical protein PCIT_b0394 [Pseudoalteromonas citrea]